MPFLLDFALCFRSMGGVDKARGGKGFKGPFLRIGASHPARKPTFIHGHFSDRDRCKTQEAETKSRRARIEVVRQAHDPERSRGAAGILPIFRGLRAEARQRVRPAVEVLQWSPIKSRKKALDPFPLLEKKAPSSPAGALFFFVGAEGETRTPTCERTLDPEPSASTTSATSARRAKALESQR